MQSTSVQTKASVKQSLISFAVAVAAALVIALLLAGSVQAQEGLIQEGLDRGTCLEVTQTGECLTQDPAEAMNNVIRTIINILSLVVGVVAVIMIVIGGFRYIISGGDSGNVTAAKNTILYAIVGLVIVALAQVIVRFVLGSVTQT